KRKKEKFSPKLRTIERVFQDKLRTAQATPEGQNPDMVLVFEVKGNIGNFFGAVGRIAELQWLCDYEDVFAADDDIFYEKYPNAPVDGKLYFVMSNYTSLQQILRLW